MTRPLSQQSATGMLVLVAALLIMVWLIPPARHYLAVDRCLDAGGAYDQGKGQCRLPPK